MVAAGIPYDQLARFEGTRRALRTLAGGRRELRILDVGGFPCSFARYLAAEGEPWRVETADVARGEMEGYHPIEPGPLPFAAGSFDFTVANDTLEHVPPDGRREFVRELARVSRHGAVISGPYHSETIASVERCLTDLHAAVHGTPHPWLAEHRLHGLPLLRETVEGMLSVRGQPPLRLVLAEPNAPLESWLVWHWSHIARGASERFADFHARWDGLCSRVLMGRAPERRGACYRRVLAFAREGEPIVEPTLAEDPFAPLLAEMLAVLLGEALRGGGPGGGEDLLKAVDERLAASMALLEAQAPGRRRRGLIGRLRGA